MTFPTIIKENIRVLKRSCECLFVLFLIVPGLGPWLDGIPLGTLHELIVLTVMIGCFMALPENKREKDELNVKWYAIIACVLIIAMGIKIAARSHSSERGAIGAYYAPETTANGTKISLLETRVDPEIDFKTGGYPLDAHPFPLWFMNDKDRFGDYSIGIDKTVIPFETIWKSNIRIRKGSDAIVIAANGDAKVYASLNGIPISGNTAPIVVPLAYEKGTTPLEIRYESGAAAIRDISLSWKNGGDAVKISEEFMRVRPETEKTLAKDDAWQKANTGILMITIALFVGYMMLRSRYASWRAWLRSDRFVFLALGAAGFAFFANGLIAEAGSRYFNLLPAGDDPLLYETFARHIVATGDWAMTAYEKHSYYWQILYYYLLAIAHFIFGEAIFPILWLQGIALTATALLTIKIGEMMVGKRDAFVYAAGIGVFLHPMMREYAMRLYPIGALLAVGTVIMLLYAEKKGARDGALRFAIAGILGGLLVLMRNNMQAFIALALIWIMVSLGRKSAIPLTAFILGYGLVLAPFLARNYAFGEKMELLSRSSGTSSLMIGTPVPEGFVPQKTLPRKIAKMADRFVDGRATRNLQWIWERPWEYGEFLVGKAGIFFGIKPFYWPLFAPFVVFIPASVFFLAWPETIKPGMKRKNYILLGGMVIAESLVLTIVSVGFFRYLLPLIPFTLILIALSMIGMRNLIRKRLIGK